METSTDAFLNGQLSIIQPRTGYRAGSDTVLLAAAIPVQPHERVLEVGMGVGTALLCVSFREPTCHLTGIEFQKDLVDLAHQNMLLNQRVGHTEVILGDIMDTSLRTCEAPFDHVFSNPPYFQSRKATLSPTKAQSRHESTASLQNWIEFCVKMLRPKGTLTLIFPTERLGELLCLLHKYLGHLVVFPLWPKEGYASKRVIVQGRKNAKAPLKLSAGLVLHDYVGQYTPKAQSVLRDGHSLKLC